VIWLNVGILHHAGPFSWYVTLARRLAGHGFYSLRIDLSGSPHRRHARPAGTHQAHLRLPENQHG
jgi:hypothetical protein